VGALGDFVFGSKRKAIALQFLQGKLQVRGAEPNFRIVVLCA